jgi:hypothetical protein
MKKIILIIATILLTVACSKDDEPKTPTVNNEPFTFLKVGNEWEYGYYNSDDELLFTNKIKIVSKEDGYFEVLQGDFFYHSWWHINDDDWYTRYYDGTASSKFYITLPKNCYVGQKWNDIFEVVSISETVVVPAGTFVSCIKVKTTQKGWYYYTWYHKNYGMIMRIFYDEPAIKIEAHKLHSTNFKNIDDFGDTASSAV